MNKKIIAIIIIGLIVIWGFATFFSYFNYNISSNDDNENNNLNNQSNENDVKLTGEKIIINELTTMIPNKYTNGTIKTSAGIQTYGKYDDDGIYVTVYNNSEEGNKVYQGDIDYFAYGIANQDKNPKRENITLVNHTILYVTQHSDTRGDYRLAFFEVNGKKVLIEWLGNEITPDIKNIVYGFYELN